MPEDPTASAAPPACVFSMYRDEAWIFKGAPAFAHVGWYGRTPPDAHDKVTLLDPVEDLATSPTIIAIDAIKCEFQVYERQHLDMMLLK
eukprot:7294748-Prymnesium_polylepis.1